MPEWDAQGNLIEEPPPRPRSRREWDAEGREVQGDRVRPGGLRSLISGRRPRTPMRDAADAIATFNEGFFFGAGDEISAGIRGFGAGGMEFLRQLPTGRLDNARIGRAAMEAGGAEYQDRRQRRQDFRQDRPNVAALTEGAGGATNVLVTLGATAPQQLAAQGASRGLPLFLNQSARAGTIGAAYGGAYGFNSTEGGLEERLHGGHDDAALGAAFGVVTPAAVNAVRGGIDLARPAWQNLVRSAERIPVPEPNSVGALGRPMRPPSSQPPQRPPQLPGAAAGTIDRLADRAEMTPDDVERALAAARRNPQGQVLADVFGDPGVRTTRGIVQSPGRSGARAAEVARTRAAEQPGRILRALREGLRVGETRQEAMTRLAGEYEAASANLYRPLWDLEVTPQQRAAVEQRVGAIYADDPVFQRAQQAAQRVFERDRRNGVVSGQLNDHYLRYLHYLKLGLDDAAQMSANPMTSGGIGPTELRGIRDMRRRIIGAIDEAFPQYREARSQWGGYVNAEEALDEGAGFLNSTPEAVRARMAEMTDFEKLHARIGLVDAITQGMRGGRVVGQRNVANALDYRDTQEIIASVFDDPRQAAEFLDGINTSNQLMRNADQWLGGSQTHSNVTHAADEALHTMAEMGGQAATGNPAGAIRRGVQGVVNAAAMGAVERANNVRGEALLRRVDTEDAAEFARQVVEELRRRQAARYAASRAADAAGAGAGAAGARSTD